ncbi:unnamed protein product [Clavelina lepadiformis]|uniref:Uncharacterized protein n=1 Tax=Clavelina lepadiformis TaxID=159417 RepID=A0ABP0F7T4_CLALP
MTCGVLNHNYAAHLQQFPREWNRPFSSPPYAYGSPSCSRKLSDRFRRMRLRASAPTPGEIHLRKQWQKNSALCNRMTLSSQRSTSKNKYVTMPRENIALLPKYSQCPRKQVLPSRPNTSAATRRVGILKTNTTPVQSPDRISCQATLLARSNGRFLHRLQQDRCHSASRLGSLTPTRKVSAVAASKSAIEELRSSTFASTSNSLSHLQKTSTKTAEGEMECNKCIQEKPRNSSAQKTSQQRCKLIYGKQKSVKDGRQTLQQVYSTTSYGDSPISIKSVSPVEHKHGKKSKTSSDNTKRSTKVSSSPTQFREGPKYRVSCSDGIKVLETSLLQTKALRNDIPKKEEEANRKSKPIQSVRTA